MESESTLIQDTVTLDKIKDVWEHWESDRHRLRSSNAMVEISGILEEAEKDEAHKLTPRVEA